MNNVIRIYMFRESETERVLEECKRAGLDTSKCIICGAPIVKRERKPRRLSERLEAWLKGKKFYEWNVGEILGGEGVVCDEFDCMYEARWKR